MGIADDIRRLAATRQATQFDISDNEVRATTHADITAMPGSRNLCSACHITSQAAYRGQHAALIIHHRHLAGVAPINDLPIGEGTNQTASLHSRRRSQVTARRIAYITILYGHIAHHTAGGIERARDTAHIGITCRAGNSGVDHGEVLDHDIGGIKPLPKSRSRIRVDSEVHDLVAQTIDIFGRMIGIYRFKVRDTVTAAQVIIEHQITLIAVGSQFIQSTDQLVLSYRRCPFANGTHRIV